MDTYVTLSGSRENFSFTKADNTDDVTQTTQAKELSSCAGGCSALSLIVQIALITIASLGLTGVISPTVMGGAMVGLCVANLIAGVATNLAQGQCAGAVCLVVTHIALIVISALAIPGIVSHTVAAWCIIGPTIAVTVLTCCVSSCAFGIFGLKATSSNQETSR